MAFTIVNNCITPPQFKQLFTAQERIAMRSLRSTDPVIDDAFDLIEDPRLTEVDLTLPGTTGLIDYLISIDVLAPERKAQIMSAEPM